jgi:cytochrome c oxidase subunit 3
MSQAADGSYYIPHGTNWPIIGSIGLTTAVVGFSNYLNGNDIIQLCGLVWRSRFI